MEHGLTMKTQKWRFVLQKLLSDGSSLIFAEGKYKDPNTGESIRSGDYRIDLVKENATGASFVMITDKEFGNNLASWSNEFNSHDDMLLLLRAYASLVHSYNRSHIPEYGVLTGPLINGSPDYGCMNG